MNNACEPPANICLEGTRLRHVLQRLLIPRRVVGSHMVYLTPDVLGCKTVH